MPWTYLTRLIQFDMKVLLEITVYFLQCLSWRLDGLVAGLSGAVLLKMVHLLHSDTGHLTMILGTLQASGTNMTKFLRENSAEISA